MARDFFKNLPNTTTPITASRLNDFLDGDESMGNVLVESIKGKNLFNINNFTFGSHGTNASGNINYSTGVITLVGYYHQSLQTLKEMCPDMVAGETYYLSFVKSPNTTNNYIYLDESHIWNNGTSKTITQNDLDGKVNFYGGTEGSTTEYTISNIQIEKSAVSTYAPFSNINNIIYGRGTFKPTLKGHTTAGTTTYTVREGQYTRIGNIVFYNFRIACTLENSSGYIVISGFPFIANTNAYDPSLGICDVTGFGTRPFMLRKYYDSFLIDQGDLDAISNQNWSSTRYFYGTGVIILKD